MNAMRICIVIPYFGRWPFWMPFFLQSCRHNPTVDWLFISDCGLVEDCPPNVAIVEQSYEHYCRQVSERLQIRFAPLSPYKLCDLKPALGHLHADRLEGYDFWGFGDIDLVYGDLRRYFTEERLARFDLLSTHSRRVSGHLCLLRNTVKMREAFMRVPGWESLLADQKHHAFDEKAFSRLFLRHKNWPRPLRRLYDSFSAMRRRCEFTEAFSTPYTRVQWIDGSLNFPQHWIWHEGSLRNDQDGEREFPYFHFINWKKDPWGGLPVEKRVSPPDLAGQPRWIISARGFHAS